MCDEVLELNSCIVVDKKLISLLSLGMFNFPRRNNSTSILWARTRGFLGPHRERQELVEDMQNMR